MNGSLAWSEPVRGHKALLVALAIALSAHLLLLSIHFAIPERAPPKASLPIVQIDLQATPPSPPPKKAEMIAEREQRATEPSRAAAPKTSAQAQPTRAPPVVTPPPAPPPEPEPTPAEPLSEPPPALRQEKVVAKNAAVSEKNITPPKPTPPARPPKPTAPPVEATPPVTTSLTERGLQMARLKSDVLQQSLRDDVTARSAVLTANTRYGAEAAYLNAWVNKVESIGNQNYPEEARRKKLSGRLILKVKIDAWGKVLSVDVQQSSGQKVLDEAAENIVRMGAPYAKFPIEMREKYDQITILRTWAFGPSGVNTR
ncbi:MAG: energy transducer TonB [Halothiobacillaceae bacterium]|nr:energy transducer TonB [Halothiobacillaceae bacterium]